MDIFFLCHLESNFGRNILTRMLNCDLAKTLDQWDEGLSRWLLFEIVVFIS